MQLKKCYLFFFLVMGLQQHIVCTYTTVEYIHKLWFQPYQMLCSSGTCHCFRMTKDIYIFIYIVGGDGKKIMLLGQQVREHAA